jgi:membrane-associated progesterone receptor component
MAKLSFDEADLSNSSIDDINPFERDVLEDWYSKFKDYKNYPIVGRISQPPAPREFTRAQLKEAKALTDVPKGRVNAPLLVGLCGKVIDVSYGGYEMYGPGGPYNIFVGIDASRALAKMSFKEEDLQNNDLSDLTEAEKKVLEDWRVKLIETRKYPVVGTLVA